MLVQWPRSWQPLALLWGISPILFPQKLLLRWQAVFSWSCGLAGSWYNNPVVSFPWRLSGETLSTLWQKVWIKEGYLHIWCSDKFTLSPRAEKRVFFKLINFLVEVQLIYNIVLVSGVQHSDSVIHIYIFFFRSFSLICYYKILSIVPCAIQ